MGQKLSEEDKVGMSPEEIAALESSDADELLAMHGGSAGADGNTETNDDTTTATEGDNAGTEGGDGNTGTDTGTDPALSTEQLAAVVDDGATPTPAPRPLKVEEIDVAAERKALADKKAEIERRYIAGEEGCTDEWRIKEMQAIDDDRDALIERVTRAATLREINQQAEATQRETYETQIGAATAALLQQSQAPGSPVNYKTDKVAQTRFDNALTMVESDPEATTMTPQERVAEAHRLVLARMGIQQQAAAPAPAPAPGAGAANTPPRREVPVTLGGLPNAGRDTAQNDILAELSTLSGEDYEMRLASLPEATVQRLMRQADNAVAASA